MVVGSVGFNGEKNDANIVGKLMIKLNEIYGYTSQRNPMHSSQFGAKGRGFFY